MGYNTSTVAVVAHTQALYAYCNEVLGSTSTARSDLLLLGTENSLPRFSVSLAEAGSISYTNYLLFMSKEPNPKDLLGAIKPDDKPEKPNTHGTIEDEHKKLPFGRKSWTEVKSNNSWAIFKVVSELVDGFDRLSEIGPCVTIFGSARTKEDNKWYKAAVATAELLVEHGLGVITGGGPGIMEAGNRGAYNKHGVSVGLNIVLPFEQNGNAYIDHDKLFNFSYFFTRKIMFMKYSQGFIVMPGGLGTFDELFEAFTLIQTKKIEPFPIILYGSEFWDGLLQWIKTVVLAEGNISASDLDLISVVDTPEEAVHIIEEFYDRYGLSPNF